MKKRKPNLERLYMMHCLKETTKVARQALAESVSYDSVLSRKDRLKLARACEELGRINAEVFRLIAEEHRELDESGHTQPSKAA